MNRDKDKRGHMMSMEAASHGYQYVLKCHICGFMEAGDGSHRFALDEQFRPLAEKLSSARLLATCAAIKSGNVL